jgi:hypothetical protein
LLGKDAPGLSPTAIICLKDGWIDEYDAWQKRDLSAKRYVHVWADGIYLQARLEDEKQCILVLIGATPEGRKELVGFTWPLYFSYAFARMKAQSWPISVFESTSFQGGIWFLPLRTVVSNLARSLAVNRRRFGNCPVLTSPSP